MKKLLSIIVIIAGAVSISLIYSCKKNDSPSTNAGNTSTSTPLTAQNSQTFGDDANYYKSENDQATSDVNTDLATYSSMQGARTMGGGEQLQSAHNFPCGVVSIDTTGLVSLKKITYIFNGDCYGRHRSGSITVQLNAGTAHWSDAGAVLTFTFTNYKVTRLYGDHKSITFNGTKTVKNINGSGLAQIYLFLTGDATFKFQERVNNLSVSFDNGSTASWNSAYTTEWALNPQDSVVTLTASADTTIGGYSNVYVWGTTRFGQQFYSQATNPVVWDSHCGSYQPLSGQVIHHVGTSSLTITLGVDANGDLFSYTQGSTCPSYFKVAWVLPNSTGNAVISYY